MNQNCYWKLVSGQRKGIIAGILRFFLIPAGCVYAVVIRLRNRLYSTGRLKSYSAEVPVISIGNITVGGTGKTPLVIWMSNFLLEKNINCAILTRGYKTRKGKFSDEPAILAKNCPEAKIVIKADRVAGAAEAINKFDVKVLIMDDGFQHRRLRRDLDIVTIDATRPFGAGKCLPAGLLREPVESLKRAAAAVITRCDKKSDDELAQLEDKLRLINPEIAVARSIHSPICVKCLGGVETSPQELADKKVFAFCGIGNPDAFLHTVEELGGNLVESKIYNDHHCYTDADITDIHEQALYLQSELILTTQKDWTKVHSSCRFPISDFQPSIAFGYLAVDLKFIRGRDKITKLIEKALAGKI